MRILAIKLKQIGDTLLWEPALRRIKETFPDSELWVLTNSYSFPVIKNAPYVNEFLVFDKKKGLLHTFKFLKKLRKISFDIVINFSPGDRSHLFSFFVKGKEKFSYYSAKKAGVQKKIFSNVFTPPDTHTVLQDLWLVNQIFNLKLTSPKVNLYLNDEVLNKAEKILKRFGIEKNNFVCVHPVAKWFLKCWKPEYYGEIMSFFVKNGLQVVITSGKSQKELSFVENILKNTNPKLIKEKRVVNLAGILSIDELGGILYFSKVFFGIDTAPMHMAAALNKPVIAIFGPTGKHNWGPWDNDVTWESYESPYLKRGFQNLGKHLVIQKNWPCIPCGGKENLCSCDITQPKCLFELKSTEVINYLIHFNQLNFVHLTL